MLINFLRAVVDMAGTATHDQFLLNDIGDQYVCEFRANQTAGQASKP